MNFKNWLASVCVLAAILATSSGFVRAQCDYSAVPYKDHIAGVAFGSIVNLSQGIQEVKSDVPPLGYSNYTAGFDPFATEAGASFPLTARLVSVHSSPTPVEGELTVWVSADSTDEWLELHRSIVKIQGQPDSSGTIPQNPEKAYEEVAVEVTVPADLPPGQHRLRIAYNRGLDGAPCSGEYGEAEDYFISVRSLDVKPPRDTASIPKPRAVDALDVNKDSVELQLALIPIPAINEQDRFPHYVSVEPSPTAWYHPLLPEENLFVQFTHRYATEGVTDAVAPYTITDLGQNRVVLRGELPLRRGLNRHIINVQLLNNSSKLYMLAVSGVDLDEMRYLKFRGGSNTVTREPDPDFPPDAPEQETQGDKP